MKLLPSPLLQLPSNATMERMPLQLPFSPSDLLWRYPLSFPPPQPPPSPLLDFKTQLPASLASDPRVWSRDDVATFLKWCEREFDLPNFDMEMFQMNGKALCFLTKTDLGERCPGAGDVLHNVLQMLVRDANLFGRCLPSSPVTPTSRVAYPLSPHSHPPTPNWNLLGQPTAESAFGQSHAASLVHFMNQNNSVTLSPAPSIDSQTGSPQRVDIPNAAGYVQAAYGSNSAGGSGSNHSDSDEDSYQEYKASLQNQSNRGSPPTTPSYLSVPACPQPSTPRSPTERKESQGALIPTTVSVTHQSQHSDGKVYQHFKKEFFPNDMPEPNTNGRLLWDFLQQLLNDPTQRYTNYIAWKNHDTGVFKIVDPAGLAKLWGIQKNHLSMNYDKMSRALRYYYRVNILRKVQGERHCYQFLRNPTELKNIKNISLLRQQMSPTRVPQPMQTSQASSLSMTIKSEPGLEDEKSQQMDEDMPTDLSMPSNEVLSRKRPLLDPPKPLFLSDKHSISMIVGENLQKLRSEREQQQHYTALNLSEKSEH